MVYFSQKSIFSFITIIFHQGEVKVNSNKTKVLQLLKICAAHFHYKQANLTLGLWSSPWRTLTRILTRNLRCMDKQMERSEIIGPFRVNQRPNNIYNLNGLPVELQHKPKPNANPKPNTKPKLNSNPHGPTIKGTPRAQKLNLYKSHENMAIKFV